MELFCCSNWNVQRLEIGSGFSSVSKPELTATMTVESGEKETLQRHRRLPQPGGK